VAVLIFVFNDQYSECLTFLIKLSTNRWHGQQFSGQLVCSNPDCWVVLTCWNCPDKDNIKRKVMKKPPLCSSPDARVSAA